LVSVVAHDCASCRVNGVKPLALGTQDPLVGMGVLGHVVGREALNEISSVWAAIDEKGYGDASTLHDTIAAASAAALI
jgi:hypothetical protein